MFKSLFYDINEKSFNYHRRYEENISFNCAKCEMKVVNIFHA